jgi:hypothetical protein
VTGAIAAAVCRLSAQVDASWLRAGRRQDAFASVAAHALAEADLSPLRDPSDLVRYVFGDAGLPPARAGENEFASPAITVYRDDRFRIELLFWSSEMPPGEHDHVAPGAFAVLHGDRIHYRYELDGSLRMLEPEVLHAGDIREIPTRDGLIHSLCFVQSLSTTLSIRSQRTDGVGHVYFPPGVVIDSSRLDLGALKRLRALRALHRADARFWDVARELRSQMDADARFLVVLETVDAGTPERELAPRVSALLNEPGDEPDRALAALRAVWRRKRIEAALAVATNPDTRFLLGLLWGPAPRDRAFALLRERLSPGPLEPRVRALLDELHAAAGSVFGLPWADPIPDILELLLVGTARDELPAQLERWYEQDAIDPLRPAIDQIGRALSADPVLCPWL